MLRNNAPEPVEASDAMRRVTSRSAPRLFNVAAIEAGLAL
jgi:hypothetical protein